MFGRVALALRGKLVVTALAAALLIGSGSVAVAAATQGHILDLTPRVQPTHTQELNGNNDKDNDEQCEATPAAGHECDDNNDDNDQGENCKATPSAGHNCADNDEDDNKDEHGSGQNGNGDHATVGLAMALPHHS